jgi:hypothetical protein
VKMHPMRKAALLPLDPELVESCLDLDNRPIDRIFSEAWRYGLPKLTPEQRRSGLAGATGHIAESLVELLLAPYGYIPIHHFVGPGRHGVDLLLVTPDTNAIVAVEVKGTLCHGRWPRLSRTDVQQMSAEWVNKSDNPGMAEWDLQSDDIYGAVAQVNFADMVWRIAFTSDFEELLPVTDEAQLADPAA